jgi:CDP-glucose 4,6-dehydratase
VLDPLEGYLLLAERLAADRAFATAFNFGPAGEPRTVGWIAERVRDAWPGGLELRFAERPPRHEAAIPSVDSTRARERLGWQPPWDLADAIDATLEWELSGRDVSLEQIERHGAMARA